MGDSVPWGPASWAIHGRPNPGFWNFGPSQVWGSVKCLLPVTSDFCPVLINLVDLYTLLLASKAFLVSFGSFILVPDGQWTRPRFTPKNSVLISWRTDAHSNSPSRRKATLTFYVWFTDEHEDEQSSWFILSKQWNLPHFFQDWLCPLLEFFASSFLCAWLLRIKFPLRCPLFGEGFNCTFFGIWKLS